MQKRSWERRIRSLLCLCRKSEISRSSADASREKLNLLLQRRLVRVIANAWYGRFLNKKTVVDEKRFILSKGEHPPIIVFVNMEIMRAPNLPCRIARLFSGILFLNSAAHLLAADIVLQKVPPLTVEQAPSYPENLARYA